MAAKEIARALTGRDSVRVARGSSYYLTAEHCRSAYRSGVVPSFGYFAVGFLVPLSPSGVELPEAGK